MHLDQFIQMSYRQVHLVLSISYRLKFCIKTTTTIILEVLPSFFSVSHSLLMLLGLGWLHVLRELDEKQILSLVLHYFELNHE